MEMRRYFREGFLKQISVYQCNYPSLSLSPHTKTNALPTSLLYLKGCLKAIQKARVFLFVCFYFVFVLRWEKLYHVQVPVGRLVGGAWEIQDEELLEWFLNTQRSG